MPFVLDASVSMSWCFEDEGNGYGAAVLEMLDGDEALAPAVWPLEVANALRAGERRRRLRPADVGRFAELLRALPISVEGTSLERAVGPVLEIAREHELSSYDASYVELAIREGLPLATLDGDLRAAADRIGVPLVD